MFYNCFSTIVSSAVTITVSVVVVVVVVFTGSAIVVSDCSPELESESPDNHVRLATFIVSTSSVLVQVREVVPLSVDPSAL